MMRVIRRDLLHLCVFFRAEMQAIDQESHRLNAILELEEMKRALLASTESSGPTSGFFTSDQPPSPPPPRQSMPPPPPRESELTAEDQARLARLLAEDDDDGETGGVYHAQTSTLRMLTGEAPAPAPAPAGGAELPEEVARLLADAEHNFEPNRAALDLEVQRMEAELRALTLQRDMMQQQAELNKLTAMLADAEAQQLDVVSALAGGAGPKSPPKGPRRAWDDDA